MFTYSSSDTVIPTLTFSKAELVYLLKFLINNIPNSNTSTQIEMVEVRHYLNQIKERVLKAAYDGELKDIVSASPQTQTQTLNNAQSPSPPQKREQVPSLPSLKELKEKFPTLTEDEIKGILKETQHEREMQKAKEEAEAKSQIPKPPSFIAREDDSGSPSNPISDYNKEQRENSQKFASMLGGI